MTTRTWIRNEYGSITDGDGWDVYRDADDTIIDNRGDLGKPWSLWHYGEYVGNYATVEDAKAATEPLPLPNINLSASLTNAQVLARQAWEALDDEREGDLTRLVNDLKAEVDEIHDLVSRW